MKQMYKALVLAFVFLCNYAVAQQTITGTVISSEDRQPVVGANVMVQGTTTGTATDIDGKFTLSVNDQAKNLVFTYVGMKKKVLPIGTGGAINVALDADQSTFDDVVVTALAIKREKRSLGYATTTISGDDINRVSQNSALSALQGKVAGAQISNATGAPGGSTSVILRGGSSFTGDNNALIVVDGVPVDNSNFGFDDVLNNQYDAGNRGNDINPQDIASVTTLNGAAAVALYGQRGANGAVLYTTKKGTLANGEKTGKKFMVEFNTQTSFLSTLKLPTYQTQYGQGGEMNFDSRENFNWGPKLDGAVRPWGQVVDGEQRVKPYTGLPNALRNFFNTGKTYNNNLSISGGGKGTQYYLSYNNFKYDGVFPGTGYQRNSIRANVSHDFGDKLSSAITFNYNKTNGDLIVQGQSDFSPYFNLLNIPIDIPIAENKDLNNKFNTPENYFGAYYQNPYWILAHQKNTNDVDRFNTNITLDYKPTNWLTFTGRVGNDIYTDARYQKWLKYSFVNQLNAKDYPGRYSEDVYRVNELNADVIIRATKTFKEKYSISALIGTNIYTRRVKNTYGETAGLAIADQYSFDNSLGRPILNNSLVRKRIAGVYFDVNFGYKNFFFLDITGRNDWSSTLPVSKRSYFYPSVSTSLVLSELIKADPMALSYWKIRASFAQVGKDAEPYSLKNVFVSGSVGDGYNTSEIHSPFVSADGSSVLGYTLSNRLRNDKIKPEISTTVEAGTEIAFLNDRLRVDFTYYWKRTKDEIMAVPAAPSSGFTQQIINAGILENKGVELAIHTVPVLLKQGFKWEIYGTFYKNWSKVIKVSDNAEQLNIGGLSSMAIVIQKGQPYGTFYSITSERDPNGNPIVEEATGKPIMTTNPKVVGTFAPSWIGSIGTALSYKGLRFSMLFDAHVGGQFYSATRDIQQFTGTDPLTLYNDRKDFVVPNSVYKGSDGAYHANTKAIHYQDYWTNYLRSDYANNLVSATYVKLREVALSYDFPKKWMTKTKFISKVELNLFGNNVWMWVPKSNTYADPEVNAYGAGNARGFEFYNLPSLKTFGFGAKVQF